MNSSTFPILTYSPLLIAWGVLCADKPKATGVLAVTALVATSVGITTFIGTSKRRALAPPCEPGLMCPMYIMTAKLLFGSFNSAIWAIGIWFAVVSIQQVAE